MPITTETIRLAVDRGVDPEQASAHTARFLTPETLGQADLILTMTRDQRRHVVELLPAALRRTVTLREFSRLAAGMTGAEIRSTPAAADGDRDPVDSFESALERLVARRGLIDSPANATDDDVVDPFRRSMITYERSAAEIDPGLSAVARFVRLSASTFPLS